MLRKSLLPVALLAGLTLSFPAMLHAQTAEVTALNTTSDPENETPPAPQTPEDAVVPANPNYRLKWKVDAPIIGVGTAWTLYGFSQVYNKPNSSLTEIQSLRKEDVNGFDRWAAGKNSESADANSNILFYGLIPAPLIMAGVDKNMRKDFWKIGALYWETMAITGTLYTSATYFVDRYRPETYDLSTPAGDRTGGNYKNAFFAGHVANVGAISFFTAKIFHDYYPNSRWKWAFWSGAGLATATTAYLRHEAGKHWPSDLLLGALVGAGTGILVPQLHKKMKADGTGLRITPYVGSGNGLCFTYRF